MWAPGGDTASGSQLCLRQLPVPAVSTAAGQGDAGPLESGPALQAAVGPECPPTAGLSTEKAFLLPFSRAVTHSGLSEGPVRQVVGTRAGRLTDKGLQEQGTNHASWEEGPEMAPDGQPAMTQGVVAFLGQWSSVLSGQWTARSCLWKTCGNDRQRAEAP